MRVSAVGLVSCVVIGCGGGPDANRERISLEVEAQLAAARTATVPQGVSLANSSGPTRQAYVVSADWSFDLQTDWDTYASRGVASLERSGYEAVGKGGDGLAFAKHLPGDSYRLRIARKGSPPAVRVTVTFSASPD
jgi:hypothetical protein